jgi:hypothetical protein
VDVLWLRNPLPFFTRLPGADVLTSSDHLTTTAGQSEALERYPESGSAFNIGIMLFTEKSLPFVREWIDVSRLGLLLLLCPQGGGGKEGRGLW